MIILSLDTSKLDGVNSAGITAFGMTETETGSILALRTVFSFLIMIGL